jgi:hypothetical protein
MDTLGNKDQYTRKLLSLVKAVVPKMSQKVSENSFTLYYTDNIIIIAILMIEIDEFDKTKFAR